MRLRGQREAFGPASESPVFPAYRDIPGKEKMPNFITTYSKLICHLQGDYITKTALSYFFHFFTFFIQDLWAHPLHT